MKLIQVSDSMFEYLGALKLTVMNREWRGRSIETFILDRIFTERIIEEC